MTAGKRKSKKLLMRRKCLTESTNEKYSCCSLEESHCPSFQLVVYC
jgi:hypothetical protein